MAIVLGGVFAEGFSVNDAIKMNSEGFAITFKKGQIIIEKEKSA